MTNEDKQNVWAPIADCDSNFTAAEEQDDSSMRQLAIRLIESGAVTPETTFAELEEILSKERDAA